ncbi:MAG: MATE family efflux transporter [Clostridia bacterium]|nr:MATE family efflux transporter [Clostridia bacterium]
MQTSRHTMDMTDGPIGRQLIAFAIPVFLGELFQLSYSVIDSAIVGNFIGSDALAAVGASETMTRVIVGFFNGVSLGCTVVVARAFGRKAMAELKDAVHTIILLSLAMGVTLGLLGVAFTNVFIRLMDIPAETAPLSATYLHIYFGGLVGLILYNTISGILRAVGDSRRPLYFLIFSSILNTLLDVLFVAVFHWGVSGAAFATIASQIISAILCLCLLIRTEEPWRFEWRGRIDMAAIREIFTIGIPTGLQKSIVSVSNVLVLSHISYFGTSCLAAWVVYSRMSHVLTMTVQSVNAAQTTFIGQNIGARKWKRAEDGTRVSLMQCMSVVAVLAVLIVLLRGPVSRIFGDDPAMLAFASDFALYLIPLQLIHSFMGVYIAVLRGCGKAAAGTVFMIGGLVVARQIYLRIITGIVNTPLSVGLAWPLGWLVSGTMIYIYYKKKRLLAEP